MCRTGEGVERQGERGGDGEKHHWRGLFGAGEGGWPLVSLKRIIVGVAPPPAARPVATVTIP
jgi:hypothetical protein